MFTLREMGRGCVVLAFAGCERSHGAELVGDQCVPELLPSSPDGFGFFPNESYVTEASACDGHPCLVHRLDNRSDGGLPANPNVVCEGSDPAPGCVTAAALERSVHCSCQCDGPGDRSKYCTCPDGFLCRQLFTVREDSLHNSPRSYCVRPAQ